MTNDGLRAVAALTSLTHLDLTCCSLVTNDGLRAVAALTSLIHLDLREKVTADGLPALSSLPVLTELDVSWCNVTAAGVDTLRNTTASPSLDTEL